MSLFKRLKALAPEARASLLDEAVSLSDYEMQQRYDEMLDDAYGMVSIAGLEYPTSDALKEVDATAYRCGFADFMADGDEWVEFEGRYYEIESLSFLLDEHDDATGTGETEG